MIDPLRHLLPGDVVSTIVAPGLRADVPIKMVVHVDGYEFLLVATRQEPGQRPELAVRDRGNCDPPQQK